MWNKRTIAPEEKEGYKFCGYYNDSTYTGKKENKITNFPCYKRQKYKIKYKLNKGKNSAQNPKYYFYDTVVNLDEPTRTHYKFLGWCDGQQIIRKIEKGRHDNIVLEAKWVHELALIDKKPANVQPTDPCFKDDKEKIKYLTDMVKNQLHYFSLFEAKNTTLATVDTILLTLASLFTSSVILDHKAPPNCNYLVLSSLLICIVFLILASLVMTLFNTIFDVGKRRRRFLKIKYNHHSISGIIHYTKSEFRERISTISDAEVFNDLANQTRGLVSINEKNQKRIKTAVILDLIALIFLLGVLIYIAVVQNITIIQSSIQQ